MAKTEKVPLPELRDRALNLQNTLKEKGLDGALIAQRADTYYYSGTAQNLHVYIPREGDPLVMVYRDFEKAKAESGWKVRQLERMSGIPGYVREAGFLAPENIGLELDVLPVNQYENYRRIFPGAVFTDISGEIRLQRAVKSPWEIDRLKVSARIQAEMTEYAGEIISPGMTEVELEAQLVCKNRMLGHGGNVSMRGFNSVYYVGAVTSGDRATVGGYFDGPVIGSGTSVAHSLGASNTRIQPGETILIDLGTIFDGYQVDQTRTFCIGYVPDELRKAYDTAAEIEERIRRALVPGRQAGDIYEEIIAWVRESTPYEQNFMGYGSRRVRFFGHGVGLDLDELPTISKGSPVILKPGMVLAIEPKFVFPGAGAVGVEDTVVVAGESGAEFITMSPRELTVIKA